MIDFYRLPSNFPGFGDAKKFASHQKQVSHLESKMKEDIEETQHAAFDNFIPYIQLHEFETLVFSSTNGIDSLFERTEFKYNILENVIRDFPNPEDINNGPNTAPSVRLKTIIPGYKKVLYGKAIIQKIGIETVLSRCPRFNEWIGKIKKALQ